MARRTPIFAGTPGRLAAWRGDLKATLQRHRVYRRTLAALSRLEDRDLADLGCERGGIADLARAAAVRAVPRG